MVDTRGLLLAAIVAMSGAAPASAATLVIAYEDKEQFPNYLGNGIRIDPKKPGVHVELVQMTAAQLRVGLELVRQPWKRALRSLRKGEVDAIFSGSFSKDRLEVGVYPMKGDGPDGALRIDLLAYSLYRAKGAAVSWDGKSFSGLSAGINAPAGYSIVADLKALKAPVVESGSTLQDLQMLKAGRVEAVAAQDFTAEQLLKRPDLQNVEKVGPPIVAKSYFVIFSHQAMRADADLVRRFWTTMAEIRDARSAELAAKYAE